MSSLIKVSEATKGVNKKGLLSWKGIEKNLRLLILTITGNGNTSPLPGRNYYSDKAEVELMASETDESYYFESWQEDGQEDVTDNPYTITMNVNRSINALFLEYQELMNIFSTAPVYDSTNDNWYFEDSTGNEYKNVVNAQMCVTSDGANDYLSTGISMASNTIFWVKGKFNDLTTGRYFGTLTSSTGRLCFGVTATSKWGFAYANSGVISSTISADTELHLFLIYSNMFWVLDINTDTTDSNILNIIANTTPTVKLSGFTITTPGTLYLFNAANSTSYAVNCSILQAKIGTITDNVITYLFSVNAIHRNGTSLFEEVSQTWKTITNGTESLLWANTIDGVEPIELTNGFTSYYDSTNDNYINVIGENSLTISGYTKEAYYPAGSGMIKALPNTVTIPIDIILNTIIAAGTYTWTQLNDLVQTSYLRISKTLYQITNLVAKKKIDRIITYNEETTYTTNTIY